MHVRHCLCSDIEVLSLNTRIAVLMHRRERSKTTATAHLASLALTNFKLYLRGDKDAPVPVSELLDKSWRPLLLFPAEGARTLDTELAAEDPRPILLIVPDGSWRQASKVTTRMPELEHVERVILPPGTPTRYKLRREPKEEGLATYEAIARSLGIIEGPDIQTILEKPFHKMVERTLLTRRGL
jgi:DTW domain-containing protein YfiP